ncbi:MAG: COR domain-containing protein [Pseudomonadota bacterium]
MKPENSATGSTPSPPQSPILLVATHIDVRDANIPLDKFRRNYPQIIGQCEISSQTGQGFEALQQTIAQAAAQLPLMGEIWPSTWLKAANALRATKAGYATPEILQKFLTKRGINSEQQPILTQWLHDLGDILYFQDKNELKEIIILKPQQVTEYISKVLGSEDVINSGGILTAQEMERLWHNLPPTIREHLQRLMERFDLSYRDKKRQVSLIVERLPRTPPPDYQTRWDEIQTQDNCKTITMSFKFNTLPAGIPRWFITRSHRFTTDTHWRNGALFAHENHLALVQELERDNMVQLSVRGPNPHNFFALLKEGLEITLARFPGLKIKRKIPCLGHNGQACPQEFDYDNLLKRYEKNKLTIECPEILEDVSVPKLLYGLDWRTQNDVLSRLDELAKGKNMNSPELKALRELTQREFTKAFHRQQANIDTHCPNVFALKTPKGLQLYCQAPGSWHPTTEGGLYEIKEPAEWIKTIAPYLKRLIAVLKYAAPPTDADIETTQALAQQLPNNQGDSEQLQGAALRALRHFLDEHDPQQHWGGLKKILTPEGHYLWLCEHHAREYM